MAASDAGSVASGVPEAENCSDIRLLLSALVDNEATAEEVAQARAHLSFCADCASHLAFLRLTGGVLRQAPEVFPSASLSARIAAATYERPTLTERIAGWMRPAPVRVGLGAALATGLAMVFIVPRMGEVSTVEAPSVSETVVSRPDNGPAAETAAAPALPSPSKSAVAAAKRPEESVPVRIPKAAVPVKLPATKIPVASVPPRPAPKKKLAPLVVANTSKPRSLVSPETAGRAPLNADEVLKAVRTEPLMNRSSTKRSAAPQISLKLPGAGRVTIPRSGYDRTAATENQLKARGSVTSSATSVTSRIAPLLPDSSAGTLAEPNAALAERTTVREPSESVASTAVAARPPQPGGMIQIRLRNSRSRNAAYATLPEVSQRGIGNLSANDRYSFAAGSAAHLEITSAPVK